MDTDDAESAAGDPEPRIDSDLGPAPAIRPDANLADEALDAMTRAVASLRDQAARMISTTPPLLPPPDPSGDA